MSGYHNVKGAGALSQRATRLVERLKTRKGRVREALVLVEGVRCVGAALDAGAPIRFAVVAPSLEDRPEGATLIERLGAAHVDIRAVDDDELAELADTEAPQGVLAVAEEPRTELTDLRPGCWLVLDAVQDPGNAGTLVRAATAFGVDGVVSLDGTVDLWGPKAVRASAGLVYRVPIVRADVGALVQRCGSEGVEILVADASGEDVAGLGAAERVALVVGNEGAGVRDELVRAAGRRVSVPMQGSVESLNVGVAGSILLYAI
ncbi:MAG: RNA methyltransferase, partial [Gemmatimonadota bacterium]